MKLKDLKHILFGRVVVYGALNAERTEFKDLYFGDFAHLPKAIENREILVISTKAIDIGIIEIEVR